MLTNLMLPGGIKLVCWVPRGTLLLGREADVRGSLLIWPAVFRCALAHCHCKTCARNYARQKKRKKKREDWFSNYEHCSSQLDYYCLFPALCRPNGLCYTPTVIMKQNNSKASWNGPSPGQYGFYTTWIPLIIIMNVLCSLAVHVLRYFPSSGRLMDQCPKCLVRPVEFHTVPECVTSPTVHDSKEPNETCQIQLIPPGQLCI